MHSGPRPVCTNALLQCTAGRGDMHRPAPSTGCAHAKAVDCVQNVHKSDAAPVRVLAAVSSDGDALAQRQLAVRARRGARSLRRVAAVILRHGGHITCSGGRCLCNHAHNRLLRGCEAVPLVFPLPVSGPGAQSPAARRKSQSSSRRHRRRARRLLTSGRGRGDCRRARGRRSDRALEDPAPRGRRASRARGRART